MAHVFLGAIWSKPPGNHEVTLFNRGKSNPDLFPQFRNDPWRSGYLQRPGHDDVLVMAIRCSRVFTGQQFSNGRATVPLDRGIGVETGHIELDESWQVTEYPTATVLPGLIDTHVILLRTVRWVPWIASRYGDEELDAVITEELQRQLAAGVTARDLGDLRYAVVNRRDVVQRAGRTREPEPTIVASGPPLATELRSVQLPRPQAHDFHRDWEQAARNNVALLHAATARDPHDQALINLIRQLSTQSDAFRTLWASHHVLKYRSGAKHYRHPLVGDLTFGFKAFDIATDPGQSMTILTVEAGSPPEEALNLLAGWTAAQLSIQTA